MSFSTAFLLGPMIGAYFSASRGNTLDTRPPNFALLMTLFELLLIIVLLPETKKADQKKRLKDGFKKISPAALFSFDFIKSKEDASILRSYAKTYFLFLLLFSAIEFTLCFLTHIRFSFESYEQGRIFLFCGLMMIFIQGAFVRRVTDEKSQTRGALIGLFVLIPASLLIGFSYRISMLYVGLFLFSIASSTVVPFLTILVSDKAEKDSSGACLGTFRSIGSLARAIGPIFGSILFWLMGPECCYMICALLLMVPLFLFWRTQKRKME